MADEVPEDSPPSRAADPGPGIVAEAGDGPIDKARPPGAAFSFVASVGAVLFGVVIYLVETENSHFRLPKGQLTPQTTLILGIASGALLLGATLIGRRAPVGFVALFTFLAFGTRIFSGMPFLVLAVWLLYRSYKFQKEAAASSGRTGAQADLAVPATERAASATARPSRPGRGSAKKGPASPRATSATRPSGPRRRHPSPPVESARRPRPPTDTAGRPPVRPAR